MPGVARPGRFDRKLGGAARRSVVARDGAESAAADGLAFLQRAATGADRVKEQLRPHRKDWVCGRGQTQRRNDVRWKPLQLLEGELAPPAAMHAGSFRLPVRAKKEKLSIHGVEFAALGAAGWPASGLADMALIFRSPDGRVSLATTVS
eukprot:5119-Chlamydomonas_euryale.AAC.2